MKCGDREWLERCGIYRLDAGRGIKNFIDETASDPFRSEFFYADGFDPELIASYFYNGLLPMALLAPSGEAVLTPKLHTYRCILDFKNLHVEKRIKNKIRGISLSVDAAMKNVLRGCLNQHGASWLYPPLLSAFLKLTGDNYPVRLRSVELLEDENLIAGEIGCTAGRCYTSLSGFYTIGSSGTIQITALGRLLEHLNYSFWDLGMNMPYKERLGAAEIPVSSFISRFRSVRDEKPENFPGGHIRLESLIL